MRVATVQPFTVPADLTANLAEHARLIRSVEAELCVFPELSLTGLEFEALAADPGLWLTAGDSRLEPLREACRASGVHAVIGLPLVEDGRRHIGSLVLGPDGETVATYAKRNLHNSEEELFEPGGREVIVEVGGRRLGLAICLDAANPDHPRELAEAGAEVYVLSALFSEGQEDRLLDQVGVAAGHGMWVVLSQYSGKTGGMAAFGGSGVWKPGGAAEVRLGGEVSEWAYATITS
ncbi:carbon-nitrogen hydrolase family protein [Amycolatopsis oliviviridis]|uniref:Carbon-nitrogen hydrolase family protein n=1 Tax=Amycolatopsis oliviviridis TaxID=1471590 RepID=A0ABQ3M556_9PSEU|nr:carbon-nitrogen hydrolase family protein [Amycolatopsis oliviviridis]GHH33922.1 carbon-nitrogen hydrolase family protein [Amycolatopsis oliviviridis]